jgi:hypothetical protein
MEQKDYTEILGVSQIGSQEVTSGIGLQISS